VRVTVGLPTHEVGAGADLVSADAVAELARAAEAAGFYAVFVTEHPFPSDAWLARGGHHALDPLVTLAFAAAATSTLRLHTNLLVPAYRNPFLAAKAIASLDVLSGGRVILGIGAGYLEGEFAALGADFADRNERTDEAIAAMTEAWSGETVVGAGRGWAAEGNTMLPRPVQRPRPPIWIGGNSRRAIRRAVELGDGWSPFPAPTKAATHTRTAGMASLDDLAAGIEYALGHAAVIGRSAPLDIVCMPFGLTMQSPGHAIDGPAVVDEVHELVALGVTHLSVSLPGSNRAEAVQAMERFGAEVLPRLP
jgi:probable F420-dependent oxidoreductase